MSNDKKINLPENVMLKIKAGRIKMKPRCYFLLGSLAMIGGLVGITVLSIFLISLITFSLRTHGPMGEFRYEQLMESFPWWAPLVAGIGIGGGILLLRKYDFSYKKNFLLIIVGFVASIFLAGLLIDYLGLDRVWMKKGGHLEGFYQRYDGRGKGFPKEKGLNKPRLKNNNLDLPSFN